MNRDTLRHTLRRSTQIYMPQVIQGCAQARTQLHSHSCTHSQLHSHTHTPALPPCPGRAPSPTSAVCAPGPVQPSHARACCSGPPRGPGEPGGRRPGPATLTPRPPPRPVGAHHLALPLAAEAGRAAADVRPQDLPHPADQETLPGNLPLPLQRPAGDLPADPGVSAGGAAPGAGLRGPEGWLGGASAVSQV